MFGKIPDPSDTIVARASVVGPAARAIVRMSGALAFHTAEKLCPELQGRWTTKREFLPAHIRLTSVHSPILVEIYPFQSPHSYTGQDSVEIHMTASLPLVDEVISACLQHGGRTAQPGEFTMRAFLAGKMDLSRAEAAFDVIEATHQDDLKGALKQLAGGLSQPLAMLREDLLNLLADVEAGLDFTEEGIQFISAEHLLKQLAKGMAYLTLLRKQMEQRAYRQNPFRVVLAGPPNAGKSSLFNALIGKKHALVSERPGTTRDYLEAIVQWNDLTVQLVDTAGIAETSESIDADAQDLARQQAGEADLLLWCVPCDESSPDPIRDFNDPHCWRIATKADLFPGDAEMAISTRTGQGLTDLRARIERHARHTLHAALAPSVSRCKQHVEACLQHYRQAHALVLQQDMPELLALEIRLALEELGSMTGRIYTDELIGRIFSRFCIGK